MAQNDKKTLSGYLRTHTSYDLHLWYTYEKGYLVAFFTFSPNFSFWGQCCGKGGKWLKSTKNYVCYIPYLRKHTSYYCDFLYTCVKWWHPQMLLFVFSKFWFLWLLGVGGGRVILYEHLQKYYRKLWHFKN